MSLKFKFDKFTDPNSENVSDSNEQDERVHEKRTFHLVDNLVLAMRDSTQVFLNYAYLISGEFLPQQETICLFFTTHTVNLKGKNLGLLFDRLVMHLPKKLECLDERYLSVIGENESAITEILITKNN